MNISSACTSILDNTWTPTGTARSGGKTWTERRSRRLTSLVISIFFLCLIPGLGEFSTSSVLLISILCHLCVSALFATDLTAFLLTLLIYAVSVRARLDSRVEKRQCNCLCHGIH